jgi:hypothetical protein
MVLGKGSKVVQGPWIAAGTDVHPEGGGLDLSGAHGQGQYTSHEGRRYVGTTAHGEHVQIPMQVLVEPLERFG